MHQVKTEQYFTPIKQVLLAKFDKEKAEYLFSHYKNSFSEDYLSNYSSKEVIKDIERIEELSENNQYSIAIGRGIANKDNLWQIKLLKYSDQVSLSRGLPIIENFGFKLLEEHPYKVKLTSKVVVHICDFVVEVPEPLRDKIKDKTLINFLKRAIIAAFNRVIENDALNKLVLHCGLNVSEVKLLRTVTQYLVQTALPFSRQYLADCLRTYPKIAHKLFLYFAAKFNTTSPSLEKAKSLYSDIKKDLTKVNSLDEDRILSAYLAVMDAMIRTNYYQLDSNNLPKSYISFKLESSKLSFLPKPKPLYEIFVYSLRFEAIHLRGGKVARGGLRWSDRREDFRTEVLGLVKAQMVKNSVIVPTGSKGGFVCKRLPAIDNREAYMQEGIDCYKNFIAGLLDITDNLVAGAIVPPKNVIRYDNDDPYLVVAADKGTATFSDYANQMSQAYGFWLGDAFASGGSAGYDHKKIGITARGVWESVKRHFRHLDIDTQKQEFTVIGIGDLSGDVFGNGMLLSPHIKLLAAFNHQHIFLDPNPEASLSFTERVRLFNLSRSTWADYDPSKISEGGGVFERSAKTIHLSLPVRTWLQASKDTMDTDELINAILKAQADLLYNGGIGTYIKAKTETNEMVKDKANEHVRVDGCQLQVKVVAEGGNLGVTQLGRVEFAKGGGYIYTDAIDNSAGVDCSDHEVNIKILFTDIMHTTGMTATVRNKILESMTEEVAALVLRDNYLQTEILRYAYVRSSELFKININFIEKLEKNGEIDRIIEFLPNQNEINERLKANLGLTMPELAVLLAYAKITLNRDILNSHLVENPHFEELLINYFPKLLQKEYLYYIKRHYLRKEIIANQLANLVCNRMGITFISRFGDETQMGGISQILSSFWAVYKVLRAEEVFAKIEELDNKIPADLQVEMLIRFKKALERTTRLVARERHSMDIILDYQEGMDKLFKLLPSLSKIEDDPELEANENRYISQGVPTELAKFICRTSDIPGLLNVIILANETKHNLESVAKYYFDIGKLIHFKFLRKNLIALPENNKWQALTRAALLTDAFKLYSNLLKRALLSTHANEEDFLQTWMKKDKKLIRKIQDIFDELQIYKTLDLAMLSTVIRELSNIVE